MALVTRPNTYSPGQVIASASVNADFNTLYNDYNGNITNANIASGAAIADTKLAAITTSGKVNVTALTFTSQATGDLLYASGSSTITRKAIGSANDILRVAAGIPDWEPYTTFILTPTEYTDATDNDANDQTTASSSYSDTTQSITVTTGKQGLAHAHWSGTASSSSGVCFFALLVDGTIVQEMTIPSGVADAGLSLGWTGILTAASHTVKIQFRNTDNSSVMTLKGTSVPSRLRLSYPT